jgi:malate synthase
VVEGVELRAPVEGRRGEVVSEHALALVARLHRELDETRRSLLRQRAERQRGLDSGGTLDFLDSTREIREGDWTVAGAPADLQDRRVEITGPTDRKMVINALNSGAAGFMADFEDSNSPTWANMADGQVNLADAVRGTIEHREGEKEYRLGEQTATLLVRPRGWHLPERHVEVDGRPVAGALFDVALYVAANAETLAERGSGPYLYVPKLESHLEARLWNEALRILEEELELDRGAIKVTVLIETLPAAFEMHEILWELRERAAGLNAGRWDYIFSAIKRFKTRPEFVLPDRAAVTMTVPFMRAYTELLVKTCHRRGTHAMGGMAAQIPSRKDPDAARAALAKVGEDKAREAGDGFDGTWVAHPDAVATAREQFDAVLGSAPHQKHRRRDDVVVGADDLLAVPSTPGSITEQGLRSNVNVGIQYLSSWLRGRGAAGIYGLMEDAATAEISRGQVWQWLRHGVELEDGRAVTPQLVRELEAEELETIRKEIGDDEWFEREGRPDLSRELFERVALSDEFEEFLTLPALERLPESD